VVRWTWKIIVVSIAEVVPNSLGRPHRELKRGEEQPSDGKEPDCISSRIESVSVAGGRYGICALA
jgi:hypothetical protein